MRIGFSWAGKRGEEETWGGKRQGRDMGRKQEGRRKERGEESTQTGYHRKERGGLGRLLHPASRKNRGSKMEKAYFKQDLLVVGKRRAEKGIFFSAP